MPQVRHETQSIYDGCPTGWFPVQQAKVLPFVWRSQSNYPTAEPVRPNNRSCEPLAPSTCIGVPSFGAVFIGFQLPIA
jgi:hypothetical protein